jgi:hypothetical protein
MRVTSFTLGVMTRGYLAALAIVALGLSLVSAQRPATEEGFVRTHDGLKLAYKRIGSGPRAIVIPLGFSWSATSRGWRRPSAR